MKRKLITAALAIILLANPFQSLAWGHKGHAIVAEVAFQYMSASAKANVLKILVGMSIEEAANWMDTVKSDHANDYMKPYHYIDIEKGGKEMPAGDNIVTTLQKTLKDLDGMDNLSNEEVKIRILYLMHLIGDLHQPLHVGYPGDKGGNTVQLSFLGRGTNLHAVWDSGIIEYKGIDLAEVLKTNAYSPEQLTTIKKMDVIAWAAQTRGHLKKAYQLPSAKVSDQYIDANAKVINGQLLNAGIRLGAVLDHYFKDYRLKS